MIINCFLHNKKPINLLHENLDFFFFGKKKISFGICPKCGHIFQSQTISRRELNIHYKKMQLHIDNLGKPSVQKKEVYKGICQLLNMKCLIFQNLC
tara:strand:+ start:36 stop:323 length:288 start_codon:yes stop_codon:yes gene_type:complete